MSQFEETARPNSIIKVTLLENDDYIELYNDHGTIKSDVQADLDAGAKAFVEKVRAYFEATIAAAAAEAVRAFATTYGKHLSVCVTHSREWEPCNCGFATALTKPTSDQGGAGFDPSEVTICGGCNCMTHTNSAGFCGKCGVDKSGEGE